MCERLNKIEEKLADVGVDGFWDTTGTVSSGQLDGRDFLFHKEPDLGTVPDSQKHCLLDSVQDSPLFGDVCYRCGNKIFLRKKANFVSKQMPENSIDSEKSDEDRIKFIQNIEDEAEVDKWLAQLRKHIFDPNSKLTFEIPEKYTQKEKQWRFLHFLQDGLIDRSADHNVLVCGMMSLQVKETIVFQIGYGLPQIGNYIPWLHLKENTSGNTVVEVSAKNLARVKEDWRIK